ncbi:MAG: RND transporter, partial [Desulfobacterales bacterium]|nr:RND transporter [Desulfobacterales bacterium]
MKQLILIAAVLLISGCSAVREYKRPDMKAGFDTINLLEANDVRFQAADPVIKWWQHFNDPQLNTIMTKALD